MQTMEYVPNSVVRSGWLWRQSKFLKKWKRAWFVLWRSGRLSYHEKEFAAAEDFVHIPNEQPDIMDYRTCSDVTPPEFVPNECLFCVRTATR